MNNITRPAWVSDQYEQSRLRFANVYTDYVRQHKQSYADIQAELTNIFLALNQVIGNRKPSAVEMVNDLGDFFMQQGYWQEGGGFAEQVLPVATDLHKSNPAEDKHTYALASLHIMCIGFLLLQGDVPHASEVLQKLIDSEDLMANQITSNGFAVLLAALSELQANPTEALAGYQATLDTLEPAQHLPLFSYLLSVTADLLAEQEQFEEALSLYQRKMTIDRQTKDISSIIESLLGLARIAHKADLIDVAQACYEEAAEIAETFPDPMVQHDIFKELGKRAYEREDYAAATHFYEQALALAHKSGNKWAVASTLTFLAYAKEELGEDVTELLRESLSICRKTKDYPGMVMAMIQLGDVYLSQQRSTQAKEQFTQAADISSRIKNQQLNAFAHFQLGDLASSIEDWAEAQAQYEKSVAAHQHFNDPAARAMVLRSLGQAQFMQQDLTAAGDNLRQSAALYAQQGEWEIHVQCLYELAQVLAKDNHLNAAYNLLQEGSAILHNLGSPEAADIDAALARFSTIDSSLNDLDSQEKNKE